MNLLTNEWLKFKQNYSTFFVVLFGLSVLTFFSAYFGMLALGQETIDEFMRGLVDRMGGEEAIKEKMQNRDSSFFFILQNNLKVSVIVLLSGLIPFYFMTLVVSLPSMAMTGVVLAHANMNGENPALIFITSILPHGFTELTEFFIISSISMALSHQVTKKIFRKKRNRSIKWQMRANLQTFLILCIPLVIISAVIEAYVTPFISR
jgi:stage II sporulation protein M